MGMERQGRGRRASSRTLGACGGDEGPRASSPLGRRRSGRWPRTCTARTGRAERGRSTPPPVAERLRRGELRRAGPSLWGVYRSPWGDIQNIDQLNRDVARRRAMAIARELGTRDLQESLVIRATSNRLRRSTNCGRISNPRPGPPRSPRKCQTALQDVCGRPEAGCDSLPQREATVQKPGDATGLPPSQWS